jgi:hypothetical protein
MCDALQPPPFQALSDILRYTTEELRSAAAQYTTSNEMAKLRPAPSSRVATPSYGKEAAFDITIHDAKGGNKRHKQHPQHRVRLRWRHR